MDKKSTKTSFLVTSSTISTPTSTSITVSGEQLGDEEKEFLFPEAIPSEEAVESLDDELGISFQPDQKKQIIETIDHSKTYVSEFEASFSLSGLKIRIKREPKKTIKLFNKTAD